MAHHPYGGTLCRTGLAIATVDALALSTRRSRVTGLRGVVSSWEEELVRGFPEVFVSLSAAHRSLIVTAHSHEGSLSTRRVPYPADLDRLYDVVAEHVELDAARSRLAGQLTEWAGFTYPYPLSAAAGLIIRWLVFSQGLDPRDGELMMRDNDDVSVPWPTWMSLDLDALHRATRRAVSLSSVAVSPDGRMRVTRERNDGAGHVDDSFEVDLHDISLREFQTAWWAEDADGCAARAQEVLDARAELTAHERVAVGLLEQYDGGAWLLDHHFQRDVVRRVRGQRLRLDWCAASRRTLLRSDATAQDRAVLAVACHLSDAVVPPVTLAAAMQHVGSARDAVLAAVAAVADSATS